MSERTNPDVLSNRLLNPVAYIHAIARNIRWVIAGTLAAGALGVASALNMPEKFESSAMLMVSPPPFRMAEELEVMMPRSLAVPDYRLLLTSDGILMRAAERAMESGNWDEESRASLRKVSSLKNRMDLTIEVAQKTVATTVYSPMIRLTATADTAERARDLAAAWATVCEEVAREAFESGKRGLRGFVEERFLQTRRSLEQVGGQIRDMEVNWNDELMKAQLAKTHQRYLDYSEKLIDRRIEIATTEKEIAELEAELVNEPREITLWKSPPTTAIFLDESKKAGKELQGYSTEEINVVHLALKEKVTLKRSELASMREYIAQMESQLTTLESEMQALREEIAMKSFDRKMLNLEETPHMRSYDMLSGMVEQAKIADGDQVDLGDIKLISEPVAPDQKSWPPRTLFVMMAAVSGFFVSIALVLLRQALGSEELALR